MVSEYRGGTQGRAPTIRRVVYAEARAPTKADMVRLGVSGEDLDVKKGGKKGGVIKIKKIVRSEKAFIVLSDSAVIKQTKAIDIITLFCILKSWQFQQMKFATK